DDGADRGLGLTLAGQPGAEFKNVLLGRRPESLLVVPGAQQGIATRFAREVDLGVLPAALQTDEVKLSHHALPLSSPSHVVRRITGLEHHHPLAWGERSLGGKVLHGAERSGAFRS